MSAWVDAFSDEQYESDAREDDTASLASVTSEDALFAAEFNFRDAVVLLVDCNPGMFVANEEGSTPFANIMRLASRFIKTKIINSRSDQVGVCLYNTRESNNPNGFSAVYVFKELDEPDAHMIRDVDSLREKGAFERKIGSAPAAAPSFTSPPASFPSSSSSSSSSLPSSFSLPSAPIAGGSSKTCEFHQALWACSTMFGEACLKNTIKRIFLFTNLDDPAPDPDMRQRALQKAKDLEDLDISIELFPLCDVAKDSKGAASFNLGRFYADIIRTEAEEDMGQVKARFSSRFEELEERFRKREYKKRALASLPLEVAPGVQIGTKIYCLLRPAHEESPVWLDAKSNDLLQCVTTWVCDETATLLDPHDIKTYYPYGGEKVFFTKQEMNEIKDLGPPAITLMGFKSMKRLKPYHNVKNPFFVYPDESSIKGSTVAFAALLQQMLKMEKFAVARFIFRQRGSTRFVALLPQADVTDAEGCQVQYPGFHMIFLPYADDIRKLTFEQRPIAPEDAVLKAKRVIKKLRLTNFQPSSYENPRLQKHFATLQALALDEEVPENVEDVLQPDEEGMRRAEPELDTLKESVDEIVGPEEEKKAAAGGGKKRKIAEVDLDSVNVPELAEKGELQSLTIPVLKEYLRSKKLAVGGNKPELIARITEHFGKSE